MLIKIYEIKILSNDLIVDKNSVLLWIIILNSSTISSITILKFLIFNIKDKLSYLFDLHN